MEKGEIPNDIISQQNERIQEYIKQRKWKLVKKYSDRKKEEFEETAYLQMKQDAIEMFSEMVIPEEITRPDVKRWIDRVESFRYEKIKVQFKNREWKEMLPEEWFEEA